MDQLKLSQNFSDSQFSPSPREVEERAGERGAFLLESPLTARGKDMGNT